MLRVFARCCRKLQQCHFKWQAAALVGRAAAVKVRLISPPIKPSLCMEQLSTAISKVTHQIIIIIFFFYHPKATHKHFTHTPRCGSCLPPRDSTEYTPHVFSLNAEIRRVPWDVMGEHELWKGSDRKGNRMQRLKSVCFIGLELFCQ